MTSTNDKAVLNCIFNPFEPSANDYVEQNEDTPSSCLGATTQGNTIQDDSTVTREEEEEAIKLEVKGIESAEANDLVVAINYFDSAIKIAPQRASCYNNRAQAKRMNQDTQGALEDLNKAIELSGGRGLVARQALCQRACIQYLEGRTEEAHQDFTQAASLGSQFAKTMAIKTNPYAALCNSMLKDMIQSLMCPPQSQ